MSWLIVFLTASATPGGYGLGVDPWRPTATPGSPLDVLRDSLDLTPPDSGRIVDADGCPLVVLPSDCDDDTFWQTQCGAKALVREDLPGVCADAFEAYALSAHGGLSTVQVTDPRTGESVDVQFADAPTRELTWAGMDASYAPYLLQLTNPRNGAEAFLAGLELLWWQDNCSVQSCGELAFEAYRDYSVFEVAAAQDLRNQDYRAVYERAYGATGIARRTLTSLSGESLPRLDISQRRSSYLPGFRTAERGPLYGFQPGTAARIQWLNWQPGDTSPQLAVPYLLHAMGQLDDGLISDEDVVREEVAVDFRAQCAWQSTTGLLMCGSDASATSVALAEQMNGLLWPYEADTTERIPASTVWPTQGSNAWDVHQDASDSLLAGGVSDERLVWLEDRQDELGRLQQDRRRLYNELFAMATVMAVPPIDRCSGIIDLPLFCERDPQTEVPELLAALTELDQRITALLQIFDEQSCFGPAPTACDWSPRWFATAVTGHYQQQREDLFAECTRQTADDFRSLRREPGDTEPFWLVQEDADLANTAVGGICATTSTRSPNPRCDVRNDYLRDDSTVRSYFATVDAWGDAFAERWNFPVNPDTGQPTLGGTVSDVASLGDSQFGATLSYAAGWAVPQLDPLPSGLTATAHGQLQINTRLFGQDVPVVWSGRETQIGGNAVADGFEARRSGSNLAFVDLYASNRGTGTDAWMVFDLLGTELYRNVGGTRDPNSEGPLSYHYVAEPEPTTLTENVGDVRTTVFVGPVPLNLRAGAAGTVGIETRVQMDATGGSEATGARVDAFTVFRPFATASVFAEASVGVRGLLSGGIRADLDLIEVGLPVTTTVQAVFDPVNDNTELNVDVSADLELILLRGRVRGFVELPWEEYSQTLFRFDGIRQTAPLARTQFDADLSAIRRAFGIDAGEAATLRRGETATTRLVENRPGTCEDEVRIEPDVYVDFDDESIADDVLTAVLGQADLDVTGISSGQLGIHGQSIRTDGFAVSAASTSVSPLAEDRTVAFWFRPETSIPSAVLALGTDDTTSGGVVVRTATDNQLRVELPCDTGRRIIAGNRRTEVTWHHIAISHSTATRQVITLLDGQPLQTVGNCRLDALGSDLHVGGIVRGGVASDTGSVRVDELGIWNGRALDVHQLRELLSQGDAGLPLAGSGSAPLTTVRNVSGDLRTDDAGLRLNLSWENPPSLSDPDGGYNRVIVRTDTDAFPTTPQEGALAYEGTGTGVVVDVVPGTPRVYVSTWAVGPAGTGIGDRIVVSPDAVDLPALSDLQATPGDRSVRVAWTFPADPNVATVLIAQSDRPLERPEDGALVYQGRATETVRDGLPNGLPVVFTAWTVDGFGRRSAAAHAQATPFAGARPDVLAPGAIQQLQSYATADRVRLQWELPFDLDPLSTVVRRVERGIYRRTLGTVTGNTVTDVEVVPGRTYRYELATVDPAGNTGPGVAMDVSVEVIEPLLELQAHVDGADVQLSWPTAPSGTSVVVVRSVTGPSPTAWDGDVVCERSGLRSSCTDASVPADTPLFYTAFVQDSGAYSSGVSTHVTRTAAEGQAGEDRDVFVGERVDLVSDVSSAAWTADVPLIRDASGVWFLATEPGPVTANLTGQDNGDDVDDDVIITVLPYDGPTNEGSANPLATGRLVGRGVQGLFARDTDIVADLGDGDVLLIDGLTETPRTLTNCSTLRHVDGNLAICGDAFQTVRGYDLSTGDQVWTTDGPQGTWVSSLNGGVFALLTTSLASDAEVRVALVDETDHLPLGTAVLATTTGIPLNMALDDTGDTLAVASFTQVTGFTVSGLADTVDVFPLFTEAVTDTGVGAVSWNQGNLVIGVQTEPGVPSRLREYAVGTSLAMIREVDAPADLTHIETTPAGLLLVGNGDAALLPPSGAARGPFTGTSYAIADAVYVDSTVWVAAVAQEGIGGDQVTVHPATSPRLSGDAQVLFDPLDIGFSFVDALVSARGNWAAKALDQLAIGTADGLTASGSIGFSTAPFDLTNMVCTDDTHAHYVADVSGVPSLVRAPVQANTLLPSSSWPLPDGCSAGVCGPYGALLLCGTDLVQHDLVTGQEVRREPLPSEMAFPQLQPQPTGAMLTDFGANGEIFAAVSATSDALTLTPAQEVPGYFGGGALIGTVLHLPGVGLSERVDLSGVQTSLTPIAPADAEVLTWDLGLASLIGTRRDAVLRAGQTGLLAGSTGDKSLSVVSDNGLAIVNTGTQVVAHRLAPVGVVADIHSASTGDFLTTEVMLDDSLDLTGVRVDCAATTGVCIVDDVDLTRRIATVSWAAGTSPGNQQLTVWVGTHRWFTTAIERISVELP